ncbi:unnamed protein product, partial [Trichogramma brassicae]
MARSASIINIVRHLSITVKIASIKMLLYLTQLKLQTLENTIIFSLRLRDVRIATVRDMCRDKLTFERLFFVELLIYIVRTVSLIGVESALNNLRYESSAWGTASLGITENLSARVNH